ncbi:MAG TPA: hypothetical protein VFW11_03585 [Cyclobacteriaceae bacterium]|nr:hypothetical protein [Cyclobacteriaceae bacterium]
MKRQLTIILLLISICSWGQGRQFKDLNDFTDWMTNYYKHPEPQYLFDAFKYGSSSKEIANSGSRSNLAAFFASSLRNDTTQQSFFFSQLKETTNEDFIYGFGLTLWLIHTEHSSRLLQNFLNQNQINKYQKEFEIITNAKYPDIWADPIIGAAQLDLLWADFFATGNEKSVMRIISVLKDLNSSDYNVKMIAGSAKWSLTSNAIRHDKVLSICKNQKDNSDNELKRALDEIIKTATKERGG